MLFWIDTGIGGRGIYSASMAGDNVRTLVNTGLDVPYGLTIDYHMNGRLFWCDYKTNLIESINYDGTNRVRITHNGIKYPFKLDIFENHIYWISRDNGSIYKLDKFGRGALLNLVHQLDLADDIKVYHSLKVPKGSWPQRQ
jgi:low density lipoprotein-related protein 2